MRVTMTVVAAVLVVSGVVLVARSGAPGHQGRPQGARVPVLAELFTSEGCSSCPPADDLLRHLLADQPIDGVEVIAISEHVDYWNRLGWRDPYSSAQFSNRQSDYSRALATAQIYTPQVVVDGHLEVIGNDAAAVQQALRKAARNPRATISVSATQVDPGRAAVNVVVAGTPTEFAVGTLEVVVAVVEDGLVTDVPRGENARKRLRHDAVARVLRPIGTMLPASTRGEFHGVVDFVGDGPAASLRIVAFLQDRETRRLAGVGTARVMRR